VPPSAATLALRCMDGVFLSPNEDEFVGRITEELEHFMLQGQHHRVLLFPPLSSRLRYLIHRTVENVDMLSSFSVGEGWRRRTVICHSAVRLPSDTSDQKPSSNAPRAQRPQQPWGRGGRGGRTRHGGDLHGDNSRACVGSGRIKRPPWRKPDKALYVPKAMRKKEWGERESAVVAVTEPGGDVVQEEEICPKAAVEDAQEDAEGSHGGVSVALGKEREPGEERASGGDDDGTNERPPCRADVPSLENGDGQESQDKDCSDPPSVHNKPPTAAEEQEQSCDSATGGSKTLCQLQEGDQKSRDTGGVGKTSSVPESSSGICCPAPAGAESSTDQDKSCAVAESLESTGKQSPPAEPGRDFVDTSSGEGAKGFSKLESQDEESPSAARVEHHHNPPEAQNEPLAASEPLCGAEHPAPDASDEHLVDAPVESRSGKEEEEEDKERSGLAGALWRELRLPTGDGESAAARGQSGLEDDCTAELMAEIVGNLTVKDISIEKISFDYSSYGDAQLGEGDFGHVTEIYDFSPSMKTENLLEVFSDFHESGFKIQWVDDTHALGIFSCPSTASQALGRRYPSLKIRPLIHATKQSKIKALQRPKLLHFAKERPQTDTAVAKRLVRRALGLKHKHQGTEMLLPESLDQEE
ncbi:PREDICTED: R3H and coiled-coil domain-containing protein 1, partial [Mesitornis unicolor]|uniref:R3H and coiled-coil domain-containing protein 1 n=1 Tax=Mesitornis unicolor TaxID=54374 RepID=UPI000528447A